MLKEVLRPTEAKVVLAIGLVFSAYVFLSNMPLNNMGGHWSFPRLLLALGIGYGLACLVNLLFGKMFSPAKEFPAALIATICVIVLTVPALVVFVDMTGPLVPPFTGISSEIIGELEKRMQEQGGRVVLPLNEIDITPQEPSCMILGVKNVRDYTVCIIAKIRCLGAQNSNDTTPHDCAQDIPVSDFVGEAGVPANGGTWARMKPAHRVPPDELDVQRMCIEFANPKYRTYFMELVVAEKLAADPASPADAADCSGADAAIDPLTGALAPGWGKTDTKQFVINVQ